MSRYGRYVLGVVPFTAGCSCRRNLWSDGEMRSYFRGTNPRRRSSRVSAVASANWSASTSRFFLASLPASITNFRFAVAAGMVRSPLVAKISLTRINGKDVAILPHVVLQKPVIIPYRSGQLWVFPKVIDLEFQVAPENLHREIATVRVPPAGLIQHHRYLVRSQNAHRLSDPLVPSLGLVPVLELEVDLPLAQQGHREGTRLLKLVQ